MRTLLFIILMLLGISSVALGLYGKARTEADMTILISNLSELRADKPKDAAILEKRAIHAIDEMRGSHQRIMTVGWIIAALGLLGAVLRKPSAVKSA